MKYWHETIAVAQRILTELWRRRRSLIFWCVFPLFLLLLNGYILSEQGNIPLDQGMALAAPSSLVGAALFFSCLGGSVATIVGEREQKTLKRLLISPLSGTAYFLGIFFAHSMIAIGQTILVYTCAAFFGANFEGSIWLGLLIIFLSIIAYVGAGFMLGTQLARRTEDVNTLIATFGVPLLILGGAFLPASLFTDNLLEVAQFNPIYHMTEALTSVWARGDNLSAIAPHFWFLFGFAITMFFFSWLAYQSMLIVERKR